VLAYNVIARNSLPIAVAIHPAITYFCTNRTQLALSFRNKLNKGRNVNSLILYFQKFRVETMHLVTIVPIYLSYCIASECKNKTRVATWLVNRVRV